MSKKQNTDVGIKDALKPALVKPLDRSNLANDEATLRILAGQLNTAPRGTEDAPVDPTKYSGPTGAGNVTMVTDSIPDESALAAARAHAHPSPPVEVLQPLPPPDYNPHKVTFPLAVPPLPGPTPPPVQRSRRLVLTGRNLPQLVAQLGATGFALDETSKTIAAHFFPGHPEDASGYSDFVATIYAWGTGEATALHPLTAERALFVSVVRSLGYPGYGSNAGFWTDSLVAAAKEFYEAHPDELLVFTGVPDIAALRYFQSIGFQHWHITGRAGTELDSLSAQLDQDVIRTLSGQRQGPRLRAVWSDATPSMPRLWSEAEFINSLK